MQLHPGLRPSNVQASGPRGVSPLSAYCANREQSPLSIRQLQLQQGLEQQQQELEQQQQELEQQEELEMLYEQAGAQAVYEEQQQQQQQQQQDEQQDGEGCSLSPATPYPQLRPHRSPQIQVPPASGYPQVPTADRAPHSFMLPAPGSQDELAVFFPRGELQLQEQGEEEEEEELGEGCGPAGCD
eukprot:scaffold2007_cov18-Tisochrysis_lutea.AAC.1